MTSTTSTVNSASHTHPHKHTQTNKQTNSNTHTHSANDTPVFNIHTHKLFADVASLQWGSCWYADQPAVALGLLILYTEASLPGQWKSINSYLIWDVWYSFLTKQCPRICVRLLIRVLGGIGGKTRVLSSHLKCLVEGIVLEVLWMSGHLQ